MPSFIDPKTGERYDNDAEDAAEQASKFGLVSEEEFAKQKAYDDLPLGERVGDTLTAGAQSFARQAMAPGMMVTEALTGEKPGQVPQEQLPTDQRSALSEGVFSDEARARAERHPTAAGIGGGLALAPAAAAAGMGVAGLAPAAGALFGTTLPAMATEAAIAAVPQEYDDAWLEERPMQLSNVAAKTLTFGGIDFLFRGTLHGIGSVFGEKAAAKSASEFGARNVVSEAQGAAREVVEPVGSGSVGAASARDMLDSYDAGIAQMTDSQAATLTRDAEDHLYLVSQDASESMTRLNNGLSEDLGSQLKHEDIHTYAQEWKPAQLESQAKWFNKVSEGAEDGVAALRESQYNLGNYGKRAEQLLDTFNRRLADEADAGRRMVMGDEYKKQLDKLSTSLDASDLDSIAKGEIKAAIMPTRDGLRKGLENADMFGGAALLQKGVNAPWTQLLTSWRKVQGMLTEATGHNKFDVSGAGRMTRESTVDRMMALAEKDPRRNQEFGRHLGTVLDGFNGLIEARQAHGIARTDGLDALSADVRNLMDDWNLATTIGIAKNRTRIAEEAYKRKWGPLANLAEMVPGVSNPLKAARSIGEAMTDLHLPKGSAIGKVWDTAYKRFALNPIYSDPSIIRNYPDWIAESLTSRGGKIPPPTGSVGGPPLPGMAPANDVAGATMPARMLKGAKHMAQAQSAADQVLLGKSLGDLGAIPDNVTRENVEWLKADPHFREHGTVADNHGASDGGLPQIRIEGDKATLTNGRHRLTAARELGMQNIEGVIRSFGPRGAEQWTYRGPIKVGADSGGATARVGRAASRGSADVGAMGVAAGAGAAGLGINAAVQARPVEPLQAPEASYRDALKEIDQAGDQRVKTMASDTLRAKSLKGKQKDPLALFSGKQKIQDAVEATRERLDEIAGDPTTLLSQLGASSGAISKTHPGVYMAMTQKAGQVASYLQTVIPARTATTLLNPVGSAPSFDRAWDYAARFVGATQPMTALKAITRGGAPPEMLEAVQQNWPELWDGFRVEMLGQVQRMHAAGLHIPSEKLRRLDSLLGLGGQLDPSATIEVTQHMLAAQDAAAAKSQQQAGQKGGGVTPSGGAARASLSTRLGAINQERE